MIDLLVEVDDATARRVLDAIADAWPSRDAMGTLADAVLRQSLEHLAGPDQADPTTGERWPDWSDSYRKAGAPFDGDHRLLLRSQDLLNSLKIGTVRDASANVGTDLVYARIHQKGGTAGRARIPARPYMGISDEDADELELLAAEFIRGRIEAAA